MPVVQISAVTFAVRDMARSVEFYEKLGFELSYGGPDAAFSSVKRRRLLPNAPGARGRRWAAGKCVLGERFFHVTDPDGHELSFAEPLTGAADIT